MSVVIFVTSKHRIYNIEVKDLNIIKNVAIYIFYAFIRFTSSYVAVRSRMKILLQLQKQ